MDEADLAFDTIEKEFALNLLAAKAVRPELPPPDGQCKWCHDEPAPAGAHFCSADCRDDWVARQRAKKLRGAA